MHDTAMETGKAFFELYGTGAESVLDIGALDVNGTLRAVVPKGLTYCGMDMVGGPNVDLILADPYDLPLEDESFDLVVSTSCLEHDRMFWLAFAEMLRVAKQYIYISVPMGGGPVHRHPIDAWRFYPDAGVALETWAHRLGFDDTILCESFAVPPKGDVWWDFIAVFSKSKRLPICNLASRFPRAVELYQAGIK